MKAIDVLRALLLLCAEVSVLPAMCMFFVLYQVAFLIRCLKRLLHSDEPKAAMKLITRCRSINENFKPLPEDRDLALEAAEACHNDELVSFLR